MRLRVKFWTIDEVVVAKLLEVPSELIAHTSIAPYSIWNHTKFLIGDLCMYVPAKAGEVACIRFPHIRNRDAWLKAMKELITIVNGEHNDTPTEVIA